MEHIHGIDVSWMTHGSQKEKGIKVAPRRASTSQVKPQRDSPPVSPHTLSPTSSPPPGDANGKHDQTAAPTPTQPRPIPGSGSGRSPADRNGTSPVGSSPSRRGSWFSNISSKFSSSVERASPVPPSTTPPRDPDEPPVPKSNPVRNAVLQHAAKHDGDAPYTPAPPRSSQNGIFHVFRRLSSSAGGPASNVKGNHGLVERRTLNVDQHRDRCSLKELNQAKLKRVAFCVDVEIAPMPKYSDGEAVAAESHLSSPDKTQKRKLAEKGEGEALKRPKEIESQKEQEGTIKATGERVQKEPAKEGAEQPAAQKTAEAKDDAPSEKSSDTKKKEKKKRSEEERKARKEKKRKLAEQNGTIPMEIYVDSDSSDESAAKSKPTHRRVQAMPTTNPVRIYRRCCQLRETPILKRITEQLTRSASATEPGLVEKLDLTGYWLQLPDLVTLGDYLAVVPVREVIFENCGLNDEGLRVLLAGLLAARMPNARKKRRIGPDGLVSQGGAVERLVLKNNKFGPEGWRHLCLFIYLCRTLKYLDVSSVSFPKPPSNSNGTDEIPITSDIAKLLSKSIAERLGGSMLELLNIGDAGINSDQLAAVVDGVIKSGLKRLGLAHNNIDSSGIEHVARYLRSGKCEGLDLGGNDLRDQLEVLAGALTDDSPLLALSLAEANLKPVSICKLFPSLIKLKNFRFIDLSHNRDLFNSEPSSISTLRRYLPKMATLKRLHLADVAMTSQQAIALAEILPEVRELAHVSLLDNPELSKLADARTEDAQEEACALYASLLASVRYSPTIVCIDLDVPSEESSDIVKALGKSVVAYCLRNMEAAGAAALAQAAAISSNIHNVDYGEYPDVLQHLVGHDVLSSDDLDDEVEADDDYVIGGTGVVKALACCLDNRGDENRRQSGEFLQEPETPTPGPKLPTGKAKDMSKHLLLSARKIRRRLQPALVKAKATSTQDTHNYQRLIYLDNTLDRVIKRFEDEFPDSRESLDSGISVSAVTAAPLERTGTSASSNEGDAEAEHDGDPYAVASDDEDTGIRTPRLSRSNSIISSSSKALADEEGRVLRAGHRFRSSWIKQQHFDLLAGLEEIGNDPQHVHILHELLSELQDPELDRKVEEKGIVRVFHENKDEVMQALKTQDPEYWERFLESQKLARANVKIEVANDAEAKNGARVSNGSTNGHIHPPMVLPEELKNKAMEADEVAVDDD